jgi:hypothetical protein
MDTLTLTPTLKRLFTVFVASGVTFGRIDKPIELHVRAFISSHV